MEVLMRATSRSPRRYRLDILARRVVAMMALTVIACSDGANVIAIPAETRLSFLVSNDLIAPISIAIDGSPYAILSRGSSTQLTVSSRSRLVWTSAKPKDVHGQQIVDDIGEVKIDVARIG